MNFLHSMWKYFSEPETTDSVALLESTDTHTAPSPTVESLPRSIEQGQKSRNKNDLICKQGTLTDILERLEEKKIVQVNKMKAAKHVEFHEFLSKLLNFRQLTMEKFIWIDKEKYTLTFLLEKSEW